MKIFKNNFLTQKVSFVHIKIFLGTVFRLIVSKILDVLPYFQNTFDSISRKSFPGKLIIHDNLQSCFLSFLPNHFPLLWWIIKFLDLQTFHVV